MKKPVNRIAVMFWILAAVFLLGDVLTMLMLRHWSADAGASYGASTGHIFLMSNIWSQTRPALLGAGQLAGFGVLIELVDRIHWSGLSPEERAANLKPSRIMLLLRFWPRQPSP